MEEMQESECSWFPRERGQLAWIPLLVLICPSAFATSVETLIPQADAIIVGTVHSRLETDTGASFKLDVIRVLKGPFNTRDIVDVTWTGSLRPPGGVLSYPERPIGAIYQEVTGLWFLKRAGNSWTSLRAQNGINLFFTLCYPALASPPESYLRELDTTTESVVLAEIVSATEVQPKADSPDFLADALSGTDSATIRAMLWHVGRSRAPAGIRGKAMAALLRRGDIDAIKAIADDPQLTTWGDGATYITSAVRNEFRPSRAPALYQLIRVARMPEADDSLHSAAIWALAAIHTRETVPFLASLLESSDRDTSMRGAIGLAAFVDGCPMQTPAGIKTLDYLQCRSPNFAENHARFLFRRQSEEEENREIGSWREWWRVHRQDFQDVAAQ